MDHWKGIVVKLGILQEHVIDYWCSFRLEIWFQIRSRHTDWRDKDFESWYLPVIVITLWEWQWENFSQHCDSCQNMDSSLLHVSLWNIVSRGPQIHALTKNKTKHSYKFLRNKLCQLHIFPWTWCQYSFRLLF